MKIAGSARCARAAAFRRPCDAISPGSTHSWPARCRRWWQQRMAFFDAMHAPRFAAARGMMGGQATAPHSYALDGFRAFSLRTFAHAAACARGMIISRSAAHAATRHQATAMAMMRAIYAARNAPCATATRCTAAMPMGFRRRRRHFRREGRRPLRG